jgi:hypothetical protein
MKMSEMREEKMKKVKVFQLLNSNYLPPLLSSVIYSTI